MVLFFEFITLHVWVQYFKNILKIRLKKISNTDIIFDIRFHLQDMHDLMTYSL
jgi:hypothetical protein